LCAVVPEIAILRIKNHSGVRCVSVIIVTNDSKVLRKINYFL